jgi:hypothetical protein
VSGRAATAPTASYAGLTRVSIELQKTLAKEMDGRIKPGHDELARVESENRTAADAFAHRHAHHGEVAAPRAGAVACQRFA